MSPRRTKAKDLRRRVGSRPERKTVVVFCEGRESEPDYINGLKRLPHIRADTAIVIEVDPEPGAPLNLVRRAIDRRSDDEIDECWCVFDVEWPQNHPNLQQAVDLAGKHGIKLAISNPCFELWLILHLDGHTGFLTTDQADKKSRKLDGRQGKSIDPKVYLDHRETAAGRARALAARHTADGTSFPHDNPSSSMADFLASVERSSGRF